MKSAAPASGAKFHDLTVVASVENPRGVTCSCRCVCGREGTYPLSALRRGTRRSCGCMTGEVHRRTRRANDRDARRKGT